MCVYIYIYSRNNPEISRFDAVDLDLCLLSWGHPQDGGSAKEKYLEIRDVLFQKYGMS